MDIYILRHGEAEPRRKEVAEADRKLTPRGRDDVERVVRLARAAKVHPDLVLSSPYARATQTADVAMRVIGKPQPPLVETAGLLPDSSPKQVWKEIKSHSGSRQLLLVGHEPQFSALAAYLLASPALRLDLKKGALLRIRMHRLGEEPHGELKWILIPGLIRAAKNFPG